TFLSWLAALPAWRGWGRARAQQPTIEARPTALYQQPDGRRNLVRITVAGLGAPAARARVTDRRGALVGTAGLLPLGEGLTLTGEVWVPLSQPGDFQIDVEVGRERAGRRRVRLTPPKRWTLYCLSSVHTDVGYTDLQEQALEIHRKNLDSALARLPGHPDYRFTPECALQVLSYRENRGPDGSRVLHWRGHHYGDEVRYGFGAGPEEMGRRLSDWLLGHPAFLSPDWPYDMALLYGADWQDNALMQEQLVTNLEEFNRRYAFPRLVPGRAEDFFRELERRYGPRIPVRRGDTGLYWEDGAASTAAELAAFRGAQLAARAAEVMALWDVRLEPRDEDAPRRLRRRALERGAMWR